MTQWPAQAQCRAFYGDCSTSDGSLNDQWYKDNIFHIRPPFIMHMGLIQIKSVAIHRKCADSLLKVLNNLWTAAQHNQRTIDAWGLSSFSGSFAYRSMRGLNNLSMHAYGCAVDFDAQNNQMGKPGTFHAGHPVVEAFKHESWEWGGDWQTRPDPMHFQAAII